MCRVTAQRSNVASVGVPFPVDEPQHGLRRQHSLCCEMFRDRSLEEMIRGQDSRLVLETSDTSWSSGLNIFFVFGFLVVHHNFVQTVFEQRFALTGFIRTGQVWTQMWIHLEMLALVMKLRL